MSHSCFIETDFFTGKSFFLTNLMQQINEIMDVEDNRYLEEDNSDDDPRGVENEYWKDATRFQTPRLIRLGVKISW